MKQKHKLPSYDRLFHESNLSLEYLWSQDCWVFFDLEFRCFASSPDNLGRTSIIKHKIDTGNNRPPVNNMLGVAYLHARIRDM